jgi:hypothetical protein
MLANVFPKGRANRLRFYAGFLIRPRWSGPASKAFDEAVTEGAQPIPWYLSSRYTCSPSGGAVEVDGGRPESGPLHAESSRDRPTWRPIARSDRKPGLEDLAGRIRGLTIWTILQRALQQDPLSGRSYPCVLPVRLPRLPCSAVKNSLIFFQLGKDGMDEAKCFAPVRLGFERPLGQRLPVNLPVSSEFRGRPVRYGLLPQPASQVSATRFPGAAETSTFQRVWLIPASLCGPVHRLWASKEPVMSRQSQGVIFNFRFGMPETGSKATETEQRS